jgi:hypothetical protein
VKIYWKASKSKNLFFAGFDQRKRASGACPFLGENQRKTSAACKVIVGAHCVRPSVVHAAGWFAGARSAPLRDRADGEWVALPFLRYNPAKSGVLLYDAFQ